MTEPTDLQELAAYWEFRANFYRDLSVKLKHENQYLRENTAEDCRINSITHKDKTGETATNNVTRETRRKRK